VINNSTDAPLMNPLFTLTFQDSNVAMQLKEVLRIKHYIKSKNICSRFQNFADRVSSTNESLESYIIESFALGAHFFIFPV